MKTYQLSCSHEKHYWLAKKSHGSEKQRDKDFDLPMGCCDGAEVCEIVGSYILNLLGDILV